MFWPRATKVVAIYYINLYEDSFRLIGIFGVIFGGQLRNYQRLEGDSAIITWLLESIQVNSPIYAELFVLGKKLSLVKLSI